MTGDDVAPAKRDLRARMLTARVDMAREAPDAGDRLRDIFLTSVDPPAGATVAAFWSMGAEIDTRPLMTALAAHGYPLALPAVVAPGRPLVFRAWRPGAALVAGGFGTSVPPETAAEVVPAVLIVPLLAFDRRGFRLGYGGGFYDRTIAALEDRLHLTVGVAYAGQEVDRVPIARFDRRLDRIVTEREAIHCANPGPAPA